MRVFRSTESAEIHFGLIRDVTYATSKILIKNQELMEDG